MAQKSIEKLWSEEKYNVMYHSQKHYNAVRVAMRDKASAEIVENLITEGLAVTPTDGSQSNTCQHIWGYFKKYALAEEKEHYMHLLETKEFSKLLIFLKELAEKYDVAYLKASRVLAVNEE